MLQALKATLNFFDSFDVCIWAICTCAFWGLMHFGEVTVKSRTAWDGTKHLKRSDVIFDVDLAGRRFAELLLPSAKTARPGESQKVTVAVEGSLCPLESLETLRTIVPAGPTDPLFSWRDSKGKIRPMVRGAALNRINSILSAWGWGTTMGHSFRIGGASWYLATGVSPEMVRLQGRWRSTAFEVYVRAFQLIAPQHLQNRDTLPEQSVGLSGASLPQIHHG